MSSFFRKLGAAGAFLALVALCVAGGLALAQNTQLTNPSTLGNQQQTWSQNGIQSFVKTYKYSSLGNTPAATPTDVLTLTGSATKTVRVTKIVVGGLATAAGQLNPLIIRRAVANTAGTSTTPAAVPRDTSNSAATAVVAVYTANPTITSTVGTLDSCRLFLQVAASGSPDVCAFTYGVNDDQLLVLRGVSDSIAINFAGVAVPTGGVLDFDVEWTEEP